MCSARNWMARKRNCDKTRTIQFYIVDIKVTNINLETYFILVDILWIIYLILNLYMKEFVKLGLNLNITI
jgi:hypothetical protein